MAVEVVFGVLAAGGGGTAVAELDAPRTPVVRSTKVATRTRTSMDRRRAVRFILSLTFSIPNGTNVKAIEIGVAMRPTVRVSLDLRWVIFSIGVGHGTRIEKRWESDLSKRCSPQDGNSLKGL
jgi:hypothetical protein